MPAADPKDVVRRFYEEAINDRDLEAVDRLLGEDFRHDGEVRGRAGQREAVEAFLAGFSSNRHNGGTRNTNLFVAEWKD